VPFGERRIGICDLCPFRALLFIASPKELVRNRGSQARAAKPIRFAHAGRHHQIPADKGERGGVAELHRASVGLAGGSVKQRSFRSGKAAMQSPRDLVARTRLRGGMVRIVERRSSARRFGTNPRLAGNSAG
jgi:hypothetical protein